MEENIYRSSITFELGNDCETITQLKNSAITLLNVIVNNDIDFDETSVKYYNRNIDKLIEILKMMKVEVFENERYNS